MKGEDRTRQTPMARVVTKKGRALPIQMEQGFKLTIGILIHAVSRLIKAIQDLDRWALPNQQILKWSRSVEPAPVWTQWPHMVLLRMAEISLMEARLRLAACTGNNTQPHGLQMCKKTSSNRPWKISLSVSILCLSKGFRQLHTVAEILRRRCNLTTMKCGWKASLTNWMLLQMRTKEADSSLPMEINPLVLHRSKASRAHAEQWNHVYLTKKCASWLTVLLRPCATIHVSLPVAAAWSQIPSITF